MSAPRVETPGIEKSKTHQPIPEAPNKHRTGPALTQTDEHHPEPEDVLMRISFAASREESVLENLDGGLDSGTERWVVGAWKLDL